MRDHNGRALAYIYFEEEPGRRSAAKLLSKDEARRIAVNIAKAVGAVAEAMITRPPCRARIIGKWLQTEARYLA